VGKYWKADSPSKDGLVTSVSEGAFACCSERPVNVAESADAIYAKGVTDPAYNITHSQGTVSF
jgi:hypothetical protein